MQNFAESLSAAVVSASRLSNLPLPGMMCATPEARTTLPVWRDSTRKEVRFQPLPKKAATKLWHRARRFDQQTRGSRGKKTHGGAVGHIALQVLHALIFDFLNFGTGQLDPSHEAISSKANVAKRAVGSALKRLKDLGILNWVRRCKEVPFNGGYLLEQVTNAYAVLPSSQWRGYWEPPQAPPPAPGTWGDHPRMPSVLDMAVAELKTGGHERSVISILQTDPSDALGMALAKLRSSMNARNLV